jgi:hypothetical protein
MKYTLIAAAAAVSFAFVLPASAQMADGTAKTGATMQTETSKPMASGSMAMSGDTKMDGMAMKPMKKSKTKRMMTDKTMSDGAMKSDDGMKH